MPGEAVNGSEGAIERWKSQVEEFKMSPSYQELLGIDGEAIEFPRIFDIADTSEKSSMMCEKETLNLKSSQTGSSSCRSTTSIGQRKEMMEFFSNSQKVKDYARRFLQGHFSFPGLGVEKKWYGTLPYTPRAKTQVIQYSRVSVL